MSEIRPVLFAKMHHGRRGTGGFFSRRGGGLGGGDPDFSRGRKLSFDELQLLLVALMADAPRHGYELIKLLETRSNGFYIPSPGMIYPALTDLEQGGYAAAVTSGNRRSYSLTPTGQAYLETNRDRIDVMWAKLDVLGKKMGLVRKALAGEGADADAAKGPRPEVTVARQKLEQQLVARCDASLPEQLRIAAVLERAAANITPTQSFSTPSSTFVIAQLSGSAYFDVFGNGRSVVAVRGLVGGVEGATTFDIPPDQRFYAGGGGTVRGFRFQSVGPQFADGNPVGGTSVDVGSLELRQRFGANYGAVAFVDAGQVGSGGVPFEGNLQVGAGVGARYYTGFGPIRLDVAVPVTKLAGGDSFEVYIGIGQAF